MLTLCWRNLLLYFRNRSGVFFSLLGALISFILYVAFLKDNLTGDWGSSQAHAGFLDSWLISGTLAITAITTTLSAMSQKVEDHEKKAEADLILTGASRFQLSFGYILSSAVIGFIMQVVVFFMMYGYFYLVDDLRITGETILTLLPLMVLGSLLNSVVNAVILLMVKNRNTLSALASVVGTISGFLVGAYIPIGILPDVAQAVVKLTPGAYIASAYRQLLVHDDLNQFFPALPAREQFSQEMGIQLKWSDLLNLQQTLLIAGVIFVAFSLAVAGIESYLATKSKKAQHAVE